ncbi:uncharacterized protein LOC133533047 isoform X2 [Cydia pomonella]|uniref:uncharacterized protein LOC133533047 isoform X2 n=1 Tax=Cydia pomonella TaxID=82600 RepID=UPI002ADE30E0|nr:uncharacterized protein LOC133533047 isoform X2 [Cydia pomonella]
MGDRGRKLVQLACSNMLETVGSSTSNNRFSMTGPSASTANENISCCLQNNKDDDDSSDLDELQIYIATQMHNIVIDDNSTADSMTIRMKIPLTCQILRTIHQSK